MSRLINAEHGAGQVRFTAPEEKVENHAGSAYARSRYGVMQEATTFPGDGT